MAITIQKSTSGAYFTVTDKDGVAQPYIVNDWGLYEFPNNTNITIYNKYNPGFDATGRVPSSGIIVNQPYTNIINGDTGIAFASFAALTSYILTNFFRKAGGGGGGSLSASNFQIGEIPSGTVDGSNNNFTLAKVPQSNVTLYTAGIRQLLGADYTVSGQNLTTISTPQSGDIIQVDYISQ